MCVGSIFQAALPAIGVIVAVKAVPVFIAVAVVIVVGAVFLVVIQPVFQIVDQRLHGGQHRPEQDQPDQKQGGTGQQHPPRKPRQMGVISHAARPDDHTYQPDHRHHRQQDKPHIRPHAQAVLCRLGAVGAGGIAFPVGTAAAAVRAYLSGLQRPAASGADVLVHRPAALRACCGPVIVYGAVAVRAKSHLVYLLSFLPWPGRPQGVPAPPSAVRPFHPYSTIFPP